MQNYINENVLNCLDFIVAKRAAFGGDSVYDTKIIICLSNTLSDNISPRFLDLNPFKTVSDTQALICGTPSQIIYKKLHAAI